MMLVKSSAKAATIPVCIVEDPNQLIVLHARKMCIVLIIQKRVRVINVLVNRSTMMQENPSVKSVIIGKNTAVNIINTNFLIKLC